MANQQYTGSLVQEFLTKGWSTALRQKVKDYDGTFMLRIRAAESDNYHVTEEDFNRGKQFVNAEIARDKVLDSFLEKGSSAYDRPLPNYWESVTGNLPGLDSQTLQTVMSNMDETTKTVKHLNKSLSVMNGHVYSLQQSVGKTEPTVNDLKAKFDELTGIAASMIEFIENSSKDFAGHLDARGGMSVTLLIVVTVVNVMCTLITLFVTFRDRFGF